MVKESGLEHPSSDWAQTGDRVDLTPRDWASPLTGLGQIMFQDSAVTGAFFLVGIAVVSPLMAGGAIGGALVGTLTAYLFRFNLDEIRDGIFGFNAGLVGLGVLSHYQPGLLIFLVLVAGSIVSAVLTWVMRKRVPFPTYTMPFIVTTWVALYVAERFQLPKLELPPPVQEKSIDITAAIVKGISEVMFEANVLTGALFLIGVMICSWRGAAWALFGSFVGLMTGLSHDASEVNLSLGIYGYNASLAAMALALYRPSVLLPIFGALISVPFTEKFPLLGLPTLTTPFVLACWTAIGLDRLETILYGPRKYSKPPDTMGVTSSSIAKE